MAASSLRTVALRAGLFGTTILSKTTARGAREHWGSSASSNHLRRSQLQLAFPKRSCAAAATSAETGEGAGFKSGGLDDVQLNDLPDEVYGMVLTSKANYVRVEVEKQWHDKVPHSVLLCNVKTLLKKMQQRVLVGDKVKVASIDWQDGRGLVGEVVPRKSELADPPIANVDHVLLVFAVDQPPVTRFLVSTEAAELPITVALNKCDLLTEEEVSRRKSQLAAWGYNSVPISVHADVGLQALAKSLEGRISVLAGPSGVGKSSIINHLRSTSMNADSEGSDLWVDEREASEAIQLGTLADDPFEEQRVSQVGKTGRGRHTTRHTTLLMLPNGGIVADTPGFNQPALESLSVADVAKCFPEIRERQADAQCQFNNCRHIEEPGCVVRGDWERYELYLSVLEEVQEREDFLKTRSSSKMARQGNVRFKSEAGGGVRAEVLLNHKKHRRTSRKQSKQKFQQDILGDKYVDQEYD